MTRPPLWHRGPTVEAIRRESGLSRQTIYKTQRGECGRNQGLNETLIVAAVARLEEKQNEAHD